MPDGTALLVRTLVGGDEQLLVPSSRFTNLAYPRYSPEGDRIAFMAPGAFIAQSGWVASVLFAPSIAYAHGTPWDLWMVDVDGSNLRQVAELGADDASLSWSPDGRHILVYGGSGSALVDSATGQTDPLSYLAGYGSAAWVSEVSSGG
jgi:Tol biopolymer transport system component